jgi:hypothetical protein
VQITFATVASLVVAVVVNTIGPVADVGFAA